MPKNEIETKEKNEVAVTGGLSIQTKLLNELDQANKDFGADFTKYGKTCAINCIASIVMFAKSKGIGLDEIDPTMLRLQVQNVGFTELNMASIPSEAYIDLRKSYKWVETTDKETGEVKKEKKVQYAISIKPQGAGNEKLVRKYGVGLRKGDGLKNAILIREGNEFIMPYFDGEQMTKPQYKPKLENENNKVIAVMYPAVKEDGSIEYLIATREGIKPNLIAQIRQNALYGFTKEVDEEYVGKNGKKYTKTKTVVDEVARDEFYKMIEEKASKMSVDEMLADEELLEYINPTYTSGGSKEAMIMRKMKNNALKNYPKEYDNSYIAESVKNMYEEQDRSVLERKNKNIIEDVERDIDDDLNDDNIVDFTADDTPQEPVEQTPVDTNSGKDEPF